MAGLLHSTGALGAFVGPFKWPSMYEGYMYHGSTSPILGGPSRCPLLFPPETGPFDSSYLCANGHYISVQSGMLTLSGPQSRFGDKTY